MMLRCPNCNRHDSRERLPSDGYIPERVKTIMIICPDCDDGDFHEEVLLDANGREVAPMERGPNGTWGERP